MTNSTGTNLSTTSEASQRSPSRLNPQRLINSRFAIYLAFALARTIPPRFSNSLIASITRWISRRKSWEMVQAVRLNQWVVSGGKLSGPKLDQAAAGVFAHSGRCLYDLYHDSSTLEQLVDITPSARDMIDRNLACSLAMVVVAPHVSNFDLVARYLGSQGVSALAIGFPQPTGGYRKQNAMRREVGFEILPGSRQALRQALAHLQAGGTVVTGIDRPTPGTRYRPRFFGHPATLPVVHVSLALQAQAPVVVASVEQQPNGRYLLSASDPIFMQPGPNRHTEILSNAEGLLAFCEERIRREPQQWLMFYPVWPEALPDLPR